MKKILLSLAISLLGSAMSVSAQKKTITDRLYPIPSYFTYNHSAYLVGKHQNYQEDYTTINLYDLDLNHITSFDLYSYKNVMEIKLVYGKNGLNYSVSQDDLDLTQTFFNDDEDWEYVESKWDEKTNEYTYIVKKTNGTIVGTLPGNWTNDIYIINDVVYTTTKETEITGNGYEYTYNFYTIPEFRKLFSADPDAVKATPAMTQTVSEETYDLSGRKVSERQRGIVIKDGKKVVNQ